MFTSKFMVIQLTAVESACILCVCKGGVSGKQQSYSEVNRLGFHRKMGTLRPTVGPMKRDKQLIKHKRRPPRGMHINHEVRLACREADKVMAEGRVMWDCVKGRLREMKGGLSGGYNGRICEGWSDTI